VVAHVRGYLKQKIKIKNKKARTISALSTLRQRLQGDTGTPIPVIGTPTTVSPDDWARLGAYFVPFFTFS